MDMSDFLQDQNLKRIFAQALNEKLKMLELAFAVEDLDRMIDFHAGNYNKWYKETVDKIVAHVKGSPDFDENDSVDLTKMMSVLLFEHYVSEVILSQMAYYINLMEKTDE